MLARLLVAVLGIGVAASGLWALISPHGFYEAVAQYPPYNEHLLHDIGAFNLGLGAALLLATRLRDGLVVALAANTVAAIAHATSHVMDRDLGGRAGDPWTMGSLAVAFVVILYLVGRR